MTQPLHDLLVAYTQATEALAVMDRRDSTEEYLRRARRQAEARARLVDAIERLEAHANPRPFEELGSAPLEMWEVFRRHGMSYEECIVLMVACVKMIGHKAEGDEVGAFLMFLGKAVKICPALADFANTLNAPEIHPDE